MLPNNNAYTANYWIEKLQLELHIEGGAYRRSYEAALQLSPTILPNTFHGERPVATAIYFLLQAHQFSAMHRIASDELWHFYYGDALEVYEIKTDGSLLIHLLGNNPAGKEQFQAVVTAGSWFGSKVKAGGGYALVGCTVAPGFHFDDFELGARETLIKQFPQHKEVITTLTRF
ncbi:MAG: cupin domain-containing protein [Sphingobacteriales bacterium]|nr:MAG: cupin domain-containing protein [Sphingobacteriales bacterium]